MAVHMILNSCRLTAQKIDWAFHTLSYDTIMRRRREHDTWEYGKLKHSTLYKFLTFLCSLAVKT